MANTGKSNRRSKGRPDAGSTGVGREALIAAARQLLQELPPSQVTASAIARKAGGDPALVRYYFGNREKLLLEVAKQIGEEANVQHPPEAGDPVELLRDFIHGTFRFTRSARNMQRLMIDELDSTSSPELRASLRRWNRVPVDYYAGIQAVDEKGAIADYDPLFLHLAVVGISDFFISGGPLVELLVPEGTDMEELGRRYEDFVERLLLDGLRKR